MSRTFNYKQLEKITVIIGTNGFKYIHQNVAYNTTETHPVLYDKNRFSKRFGDGKYMSR